jgi:uncharacterized protein (TIGR03790 family)
VSAPRTIAGLAAALLVLALAADAWCARPRAPTPHPEVLIVVNSQSPLSVATGNYYRSWRNVPAANVVTLSIPLADPNLGNTADEQLSTTRFTNEVRTPIESFLTANGLVDSIRLIVLTPGIPLGVASVFCPFDAVYLRDCPRASLDAELAVLFSSPSLIGAGGVGASGQALNPYYGSTQSFADWRSAHPTAPLRYLVARLAGYQTPVDAPSGVPTDVKGLIDRSKQVPSVVNGLVDEDPSQTAGLQAGNQLLLGPAAGALAGLGLPTQHDTSTTFVSNGFELLAYASWGSNDCCDPAPSTYGSILGSLYPGSFAPRAVAADIVSFNARSFVSPPSYGQSMTADLVKLGVSGAAGHVFEPLLSGVARPHLLVRSYLLGAPAVEAYYRSIPYLSWMNVWIGDPLMKTPVAFSASNDFDDDGVPDASDNCSQVPNADQRDTDGDDYGNLCDADVDQDGVVSTSWGVLSPPSARGDLEDIQVDAQSAPFDPDNDLDGDGDVDATDISLASMQVLLPPGPSGLVP